MGDYEAFTLRMGPFQDTPAGQVLAVLKESESELQQMHAIAQEHIDRALGVVQAGAGGDGCLT